MKKVFSFFLAVVVFCSVLFCSFGSSANVEIDSELVKGLIVSLSAVSGLSFSDWSSAESFADDFLFKILNEQTSEQLDFLSVISGLEFLPIDNNFASVDISPLILQTFESALMSTYGINIDPDLAPLSGFISLPSQYNFNELHYLFDGVYSLGESYDFSNLSVGLNFISSSPDGSVSLYLYFDGSEGYFIFKVGHIYLNLFSNPFPISDYGISSVVPVIRFVSRVTDSEGNYTNSNINFDEWSGSGFYGLYNGVDKGSSSWDSSRFDFFQLAFVCYKSDGSRLGLLKNSAHCYIDSDIISVVNRSSSCLYSNWSSFSSAVDDTPDSGLFADSYHGNFTFSVGALRSDFDFLEGYLFPSIVHSYHDVDDNRPIQSDTFAYLLFSKALGYYDSAIGTLIHEPVFIPVDVDYLRSFNNVRDTYLDGSVSGVLVPVDLDSIISDSDNINYSPIPEHIRGPYVPPLPDNPPDIDDSENPSPDLPGLDDSTIESYLTSFVESISRFFSWLAELVGFFPKEITFPIFGGFVAMICIGVVSLII